MIADGAGNALGLPADGVGDAVSMRATRRCVTALNRESWMVARAASFGALMVDEATHAGGLSPGRR
ncbi:hypothetical protein D3C83_173050 [compost metagenome]